MFSETSTDDVPTIRQRQRSPFTVWTTQSGESESHIESREMFKFRFLRSTFSVYFLRSLAVFRLHHELQWQHLKTRRQYLIRINFVCVCRQFYRAKKSPQKNKLMKQFSAETDQISGNMAQCH